MKSQLDVHNEDLAPAAQVFLVFQNFQQAPSKPVRGLFCRKADASPFPLLQNLSIGRHQPKPACLQDLLNFSKISR